MGKGMIIFGLLGVGTVVAGQSQTVYRAISNLYNDSRFMPTMWIIIALLVISSLTDSKGGKMLIRSIAGLIGISLVFARYRNKGATNG